MKPQNNPECALCGSLIFHGDRVYTVGEGAYVHEECITDYIYFNLREFNLYLHIFEEG